MLPKKIQGFNSFINGDNYAGLATEVTLPKLGRKVEEYWAAGMDGPIDIDMGGTKLESSIVIAEFTRALILAHGTPTVDGNELRFIGAAQSGQGVNSWDQIEVVQRGIFTEHDMGTIKGGDDTSMTLAASLTYYRYDLNGETLIEIDRPGFIYKVGGVDLLAGQREILNP